MSAEFGRNAIFEIGVPGLPGKSFLCGDKKFRLTYRVQMDKKATPNKGTISIFNVNEATVALAQTPLVEVRVLAGYKIPLQIFAGNPIKNGVEQKKEGTERRLTIEGADGGDAFKDTHVVLTFATQTTLSAVLSAAAVRFGLPLGAFQVTTDVVFTQGYAFAGPLSALLDELAETAGADWFIRDGVVQFIASGGTTGEQAATFSSAAGNLVGEPVVKDDGLEVKALLSPSLRPGKLFTVQSRLHNGVYTCESLEFVGDTHGQDWYVVAFGKVLGV